MSFYSLLLLRDHEVLLATLVLMALLAKMAKLVPVDLMVPLADLYVFKLKKLAFSVWQICIYSYVFSLADLYVYRLRKLVLSRSACIQT